MRVKTWIVASTVSTWLLTLLTPLTTFGQTPSNIAKQSCNGIGNPLTKEDIRKRALSLGIEDIGSKIEYAFERFALKSLSLPQYTGNNIRSRIRSVRTNGKYNGVKPDAIADVQVITIGNGVPKVRTYANSDYFDVKLKKGSIGPAYSMYQIEGYLDALSESPAGKSQQPLSSRPNPRLSFLTSSDTKIGRQVIIKANRDRIAIIQSVVCDVPNGTFGVNDLVMGKGVVLNPGVFIGGPLPVGEPLDTITFSPGTPSSLEHKTPPPPPPSPPPCSGSGC